MQPRIEPPRHPRALTSNGRAGIEPEQARIGRRIVAANDDRHDDARLIAGVRAGDLRAFEALYRSYHRRLARFLLGVTHRPAIVEEVLNDTMLAIWQKPESFRAASRLSTWIFAIAYRKAMRALRRQDLPQAHAAGHVDQADADAAPDRPLDQDRRRRLLIAAMGTLSADHRTVIELTYFHELGCRDIAEIMDCPVDTVKTRMFHARRNLRRVLPGGVADWL